jgi:peptide/nickel transport system permease protein
MNKYVILFLCILSGLMLTISLFPELFIQNLTLTPGTQILKSPGKFILGTDELGRSVYARVLTGLGGSLKVGFLTSMMTFVIALIPGVLSGYYSGRYIRLSLFSILTLLTSLCIFAYALFLLHTGFRIILLPSILLIFCSTLLLYSLPLVQKYSHGFPGFKINPDAVISFFTAVLSSLPKLVLIIALSALFKPGLLLLCFLMSLVMAPSSIRLIRSEILLVRNASFIEAAKSLGYSDIRIFLRHMVPQTFPVLFVQLILQVQIAILSESSLSFLGIGLPYETVTLGKLLFTAREYNSCWWLTLFPVITLCLVLLLLRLITEKFSGNRLIPA